MNLYECVIGQVWVLSGEKGQHRYCGILSNIINYPPHFRTFVVILAATRVKYEVMILYSIIDENRIILDSNYPLSKSPTLHPMWTLFFLQKNITTERFDIIAEKYKVIFLHLLIVSRISANVYDGPGVLSKKLSPFNQSDSKLFYLTSSFQCVLSIWKVSLWVGGNIINGLRYFKINKSKIISMTVHFNDTFDISFPVKKISTGTV